MQFFARGVFAWPAITRFKGQREGIIGNLRMQGWAIRALSLSALDWPLRRITQGSTNNNVKLTAQNVQHATCNTCRSLELGYVQSPMDLGSRYYCMLVLASFRGSRDISLQ